MSTTHAHSVSTPCWIPMTWGSSAPGLPCGKQPARDRKPHKNGYCSETIQGKKYYVHRTMYEAKYGESLDGMDAHHMCGNRWCANPDHIEPMDRVDHIIEHGSVVAALQRAKTHCPFGHPYDEVNTYVNPRGSRECRTCKDARRN